MLGLGRVSTFHRAHVPILICLLAGHPGPLSMDEEARLQVPPSTTSSLGKILGDSLCQCMQEDMLFNKSCLYYICFIFLMTKAWSNSAAAGTRGRSYIQIQEKQASSVDCSSNTEDPLKKSWCLMPVILLV